MHVVFKVCLMCKCVFKVHEEHHHTAPKKKKNTSDALSKLGRLLQHQNDLETLALHNLSAELLLGEMACAHMQGVTHTTAHTCARICFIPSMSFHFLAWLVMLSKGTWEGR